MLPRHRTPPPPPRNNGAQVQLHVRRVLLEAPLALGTPASGLTQALQGALSEQLAGQEPPVNQRTPVDDLAGQLKAHLQPALAAAGHAGVKP